MALLAPVILGMSQFSLPQIKEDLNITECFKCNKTMVDTYQVGASTDDASVEGLFNNYDDNNITYNVCIAADPKGHFGYRFTNVIIPQGATITSATMDVFGNKAGGGIADIDIYGDDQDDSPTFSSGDNPKDRTPTTATINIDLANIFPTPQWFTGYDITAIIQEIVDRGSWSSGNALSILARNGDTSGFPWTWHNYDDDDGGGTGGSIGDFGMKIHITLETSGRVFTTQSMLLED